MDVNIFVLLVQYNPLMIVVVLHCGINAITEVQDGGTSSLVWHFLHQMFSWPTEKIICRLIHNGTIWSTSQIDHVSYEYMTDQDVVHHKHYSLSSAGSSDQPVHSRPLSLRLSWTSVRSRVSSLFFCGEVTASCPWTRPLPAWNLTKSKHRVNQMHDSRAARAVVLVYLLSQRRSLLNGESNPRRAVQCSRYKTPAGGSNKKLQQKTEETELLLTNTFIICCNTIQCQTHTA